MYIIDIAVSFLSKQGFKTGGIQGYDENTIFNSLNNKRPLLARGCSEKIKEKFLGITVYTHYDGCHQWVIDGYLKRKENVFVVSKNFYTDGTTEEIDRYLYITIYKDYLHNNWGWNGNDNGYFDKGVFYYLATHIPDTKSGTPYNYQYDIKIVPNIRK